jgi:hypothetical protein
LGESEVERVEDEIEERGVRAGMFEELVWDAIEARGLAGLAGLHRLFELGFGDGVVQAGGRGMQW